MTISATWLLLHVRKHIVLLIVCGQYWLTANQQNNVLTHMQQQPRGWNCHNKKYYLFQTIVETKFVIAKCKPSITTVQLHWFDLVVFPEFIPANKTLFVMWSQCSQQTKNNKDTKLYVVSGVVSCNNQSPSQLESWAEIYNKTSNRIQWIGRT